MARARLLLLALCAGSLLAFPLAAGAGHDGDPRTPNLKPLGHIEEPAVLGGFGGADPDIHTDIAFWGKYAFQGNWDGFNVRDISNKNKPKTVSRTYCEGNQGDVVVWDDILVRSWNTPAGTPGAFGAGLTCDGQSVPAGWEGLHVFDISNLKDPQLVGSVQTQCGSHTATVAPDRKNKRLIVYSNAAGGCSFIDVVEVPLKNPGAASHIGTVPLTHPCHDMGVILGDVKMAACAGGDGFDVFSLGGKKGGSLASPMHLYHVTVPTVTGGHSAAFTWDGEVIVFGHEPGGGIAAECEATDADEKKSAFFYAAKDGTFLGKWTLPRAQGPTENCTIHNYNVVPVRDRYVLVVGNYQAGTWVVDFTKPWNAKTVAWSDPPAKPVPPGTPFCCDVTGSWSSYWYDGEIYDSNIGEGLNIFDLKSKVVKKAVKLRHLNPQTQEFSFDERKGKDKDDDD